MPALDEFLDARETYLRRIGGEEGDLVSEAADYRDLLEESLGYADAFVRILEGLRQRAEASGRGLVELHALLRLDTVAVTLGDHRGQQRDALILAPTHPMRALWYGLWAQLGRHWLEGAAGLDPARIAPVREALLRYLTPSRWAPRGLARECIGRKTR